MRTVVITGGSAGVGRAAAVAFARRGDRVALIARDPDGLASACREIQREGGTCLIFSADVSVFAQVDAAAAAIERQLGPIDLWVNNAMVTVFGPVESLSPEEVQRVTDVTYIGAVNGTIAALRRMRRCDRGTIIQVGSALSYRAIPLQAPYCAAKFAIRGFTDSLRSELMRARSRINVGMVHMPALNTPQFEWARAHVPRRPQPVPPIYQPEVAARAIVDMADRPRREIWVGAPTIQAIVAGKLAPGLLDRYLANYAYDAQYSAERIAARRPDNLYRPVPGLHRTHGRFSGSSRARAIRISTDHFGPTVLGGVGLLVGLAAGVMLAGRR